LTPSWLYDVDKNFIKAANNIKNLDVLSYEGINVYDIVKKENLIIIDDVIKFVEERLS
jgi:large subunit ribosomal protein L4